MMADSTVFSKSSDLSKLKVVDLKKELKMRGLSTTGDKSELTARLQSALSKDSLTEDTLDSDELDSDGVLEDDDDEDKVVGDLINDDIINNDSEVTGSSGTQADIAPAASPDTVSGNTVPALPAARVLKRRAPPPTAPADSLTEDKLLSDPVPTKKIVLNRTAITAPSTDDSAEKTNGKKEETTADKSDKVVKLNLDAKSRLEMRAKRFGLPPAESTLKEARKARFGGEPTSTATTVSAVTSQKISPATSASLDVLKKRAERFGASVSKTMVDVENKEKLEKRKAKFNLVKT